MKIYAEIEHTSLANDSGIEVESVTATCSRCQHVTESYGTNEASRIRCLVLLRIECPKHEKNFYTEER